MTEDRVQSILASFSIARILVVGDFFLDRYLVLDSALTETSLETGLDAYQVVEKRVSPGAAGTVTANLAALDAGTIHALGMIGADGEGYELLAGLHTLGVRTDHLLQTADRFTPTYTKPMLRDAAGEREINRLDTKNRRPCPPAIEAAIIGHLREMVSQVDAVIVADQVQEHNCGVITDVVRDCVATLARAHPETVFIADSRTRCGLFRDVSLKPNRAEAARMLDTSEEAALSLDIAAMHGRRLFTRQGRPLFITLAEDGILAVGAEGVTHVPTLRQTGPIDICGAGDSTLAGITLALCAGATPAEASVIGNLIASITVQQLGATGTASRAQVLDRFRTAGDQFRPRRME